MILAILQARMSSSRLPGKVMKDLLGEPMIFRQIMRIGGSRLVDGLVLATSSDPSDDPLEALGAKKGFPVFRGSLDDVLDRFYRSAQAFGPEHVVRLTGDCPLMDPKVLDEVIETHLKGKNDYTSNILPPTFPDGLDCEVMTFRTLERTWKGAKLKSEREHVTPFIHNRPDLFRCGNFTNRRGDQSGLRWTVDEPEDFAFVEAVYRALFPGDPNFTTDDILTLLSRRPELGDLNSRFMRNEGYLKSLEQERG